jgi:glycogen operon protein
MITTVATALAHPAVIAHLRKLCGSAVEPMPVVAWIDERHLPALGLANHWGYNPVAMMALDPGLCPGGVAELRETVAALHEAGIGVILDLVFNHTGESDLHGGTLSLRGLDPAAYARASDGTLINARVCGNTLDFTNPAVRRLMIADPWDLGPGATSSAIFRRTGSNGMIASATMSGASGAATGASARSPRASRDHPT